MNKELQHAADRSVVLRPERVYRALVIVTGETTLEELTDALVDGGFDRTSLLSSAPQDWRGLAPSDWPREPDLELAANECVVRIMGRIAAGRPVAFGRDMRLPSGATFTIAQAWEYARGISETAGDAPPAAAPSPARPGGDGVPGGLLLTFAALLGVGWYFSRRAEERAARDQARLLSIVQREERTAIAERAHTLEDEGFTSADALALAEEECNPSSIAVEEMRAEARELARLDDA